jgi:hypothetical protein
VWDDEQAAEFAASEKKMMKEKKAKAHITVDVYLATCLSESYSAGCRKGPLEISFLKNTK